MNKTQHRPAATLSGRYTIQREVGAGGMATVYLAHDEKHDRKVALKVLRPELSEGAGAERFPREIRFVAQFNHPHILSLYDSGESEGFLYFVMPYVEGESLRDRLSRESSNGAELPQWSPVGHELFSLTSTRALMSATYRTSLAFSVERRDVVLSDSTASALGLTRGLR